MAYQKLQAGLAVDVIPSDTINIPVPNVTISGTSIATPSTNKLKSTTSDFIEANVKAGDTVYNTTTTGIAKVVQVEDANTLVLTADIFNTGSQAFTIYSSTDHPNQGCVLYVGDTTGGNDLSVVTSSGSEVIFKGLVAGSFIPVQVVRVKSTGTTVSSVLALW
jgi:hypothetical protein